MSVPPVFNWENVLSTSRQLLCLCQLSVGAGDFQAHHGLFMKRAGCHPPARMSNHPFEVGGGGSREEVAGAGSLVGPAFLPLLNGYYPPWHHHSTVASSCSCPAPLFRLGHGRAVRAKSLQLQCD